MDELVVEYPKGSEFISRFNYAIDEARKSGDGEWVITRLMRQLVSFDDKRWFVREYTVKTIDKSFERAEQTSHKNIENLLKEYESDFFSKQDWPGEQYVLEPEEEKPSEKEENDKDIQN